MRFTRDKYNKYQVYKLTGLANCSRLRACGGDYNNMQSALIQTWASHRPLIIEIIRVETYGYKSRNPKGWHKPRMARKDLRSLLNNSFLNTWRTYPHCAFEEVLRILKDKK